MPGVASLAAGEYYAHPRNAFWPILAAWCGVAADAPYANRVDALARAGIALWDVLAECRRPGSLDRAIDLPSAQPNAIGALLDTHPGIVRVCFNGGAAAESLYRRHALPGPPRVELVTLPSTSPAHAGRAAGGKDAQVAGSADARLRVTFAPGLRWRVDQPPRRGGLCPRSRLFAVSLFQKQPRRRISPAEPAPTDSKATATSKDRGPSRPRKSRGASPRHLEDTTSKQGTQTSPGAKPGRCRRTAPVCRLTASWRAPCSSACRSRSHTRGRTRCPTRAS